MPHDLTCTEPKLPQSEISNLQPDIRPRPTNTLQFTAHHHHHHLVMFEMTYLYKAGCHSSNILELHLRGFWFVCPLNNSCTDIQVLFWSQGGHNHLLPNTLQFIIHQSFFHWSYIISVTT